MKVWHTIGIELSPQEERRVFDAVLERLTEGKFIKDHHVYELGEPDRRGNQEHVKLGSVARPVYEVPLAAIRLQDLLKKKART